MALPSHTTQTVTHSDCTSKLTSDVCPGSFGSTEHDVSGGIAKHRAIGHGHGFQAQPRVAQVPVGVGSSNDPDETANETQRLLRRLPTSVRITNTRAASVAQHHDNKELQHLQNRSPC